MKYDPTNPLKHGVVVSDPKIDHLQRSDFEFVYEPSEDTFLLMEAIEKDLNILRVILPQKPTILEIGCGSGLVSAYTSRILSNSCPLTLSNAVSNDKEEISSNFIPDLYCVDINPYAVKATRSTLSENNISGTVLESNLTEAVDVTLKNKVDVLLFNHPYVPSQQEDDVDELAKSYCGGPKGRDVLDKLIPLINNVLSNTGVFYVVFLYPSNDLDELTQLMSEQGLFAQIIVARKEGIESLAILRYSKQDTLSLLPIEMKEAFFDATIEGFLNSEKRNNRFCAVPVYEDCEDTHMRVDFESDEDCPFNLF